MKDPETAPKTCRRLKADPATETLPVIFITTVQDPALEAQVVEAGSG